MLLSGCSDNEEPSSCPSCLNPILDSSATIIVRRVLDGDTFKFTIGTDTIDTRILGIDAFETKHGTHLTDQAAAAGIPVDSALVLGLRAKEFADSLLTTREVRIFRDPSEPYADAFGRLLRHVFFYSGSSFIAYDSLMLAKGFALPD
jgi:endonuclease YncB( thermonuclease family)